MISNQESATYAFFLVLDELTDTLILRLSENIAGEKLYHFAVCVLQQTFEKVDAAHYDKRSICSAARELLQDWRAKQNNRQEAFTKLRKQLRRKDMNLLARYLLQWAEEETNEQQESSASNQATSHSGLHSTANGSRHDIYISNLNQTVCTHDQLKRPYSI